MKAGKLQMENSLLRFMVCHVILKVMFFWVSFSDKYNLRHAWR